MQPAPAAFRCGQAKCEVTKKDRRLTAITRSQSAIVVVPRSP